MSYQVTEIVSILILQKARNGSTYLVNAERSDSAHELLVDLYESVSSRCRIVSRNML